MSEFEEIIENLGAFGPYQVRVFLLVSAFETPAAWAMFLPVFAHRVPEWECAGGENVTVNTTLCSPEGALCAGANYTSDFTSIVTEWDLVCDRGKLSPLMTVKSFITMLQMVGVLIGACVTGQLADVLGRRHVLYAVYAMLQVAGFATAFTHTWQLYAVARFFVGAFFGGTMVVNFVLPLEFVGRAWRTFCGCIGFWAVGGMSQALLAFLLRDWRHLSIVCSVAGLPLLFTWWWVPESPRWLIQHGKIDEAETVLTKIAKFNKKPVPDFSKLGACFEREQERRQESKQYSYWDLFRTPRMTKNTLIMMYAWFVSSSVYYGTSLSVDSLYGDIYVNVFLLGLAEIPALIFVVVVNNRLGRRITLALLMTVAGISCFAILVLFTVVGVERYPGWTTVLAMLGKCGIAGGWAAAQVFSAEVFPTVVRNIGIGASSMAARIGGIVAPQVAALNRFGAPLPYLVFGAWALACGILAIFLPETLNQPLPDTLPPRTLCLTSKHKRYSVELETGENLMNGSVKKDSVSRVNSHQEETLDVQCADETSDCVVDTHEEHLSDNRT